MANGVRQSGVEHCRRFEVEPFGYNYKLRALS